MGFSCVSTFIVLALHNQNTLPLIVSHSGDRRATLSVIPKARRLLSLHCGPHCEELQELQEMERCLK